MEEATECVCTCRWFIVDSLCSGFDFAAHTICIPPAILIALVKNTYYGM